MRRRIPCLLVLGAVAAILFALPARAQERAPTGAVTGTVRFSGGGEGAPDVRVQVRDAAGAVHETVTDTGGAFRVDGVAPGPASISAEMIGFAPVQAQVQVSAGVAAAAELTIDPVQSGGEVITIEDRSVTEGEALRRSAEAVTVVETETAKRRTADMGEVLARTEGVGVRRSGGLGSSTRFSLAGLDDDQIRFFVDGVPMDMSGFSLGIASVPVNLVERVEIYRGVVPIRFGADALGGAVNVVTEQELYGSGAAASYQTGSLGTHRLTLGAHHAHEPTGLFVRGNGFFDRADNDYRIDVEVPDDSGRLSPAQVDRFHDDYRAYGGGLQLGLVDHELAERLVVDVFASTFDKDLQHNIAMTVPYGEVTYGRTAAGATLRYEQGLGGGLRLDTLVGYGRWATDFLDVGTYVYNWHGERVRERSRPGEISNEPIDQTVWQSSGYARANLAWTVAPGHALRLSVAPTATTRTGEDRTRDPGMRDPLTAQRDLFSLVSGLAYEADLFGDRLENIAFAKSYLYAARTEEPLPGDAVRNRDADYARFGAGNGLRLRVTPWLYAKASYEYATRLPRPDEIFGDAVLIHANLGLAPETSHNVNVGATVELADTPAGDVRVEAGVFGRFADELIVLIGQDRSFSYTNVYTARSLGAEAAAAWTSPGDYLTVAGNATYHEFRNTSTEGTFADFEGDRIPNHPYLFANASARGQLQSLLRDRDELSLTWNLRYVHDFFRGWESVGLREFKQVIPSQTLHSLALTYLLRDDAGAAAATLEVQNLTDEMAFDFFGVQRPGRAIFFKTTLELW